MNKQFKIKKKYKIFSIAFIIMGVIVLTEGMLLLFFSSVIRVIPISMILIGPLNFLFANIFKNEICVNDDYVYVKYTKGFKAVKKRLEYSDIISVISDNNGIQLHTESEIMVILYIDQIEECAALINNKITTGEFGSKEN